MVGRWCRHRPSHQSGYLRLRVYNPPTRIHVRLLGPCFKTGRLKAFCQRLLNAVPGGLSTHYALVDSAASAGLPTFPTVIPPNQPALTSTQHIQRLVRDAFAWAHTRLPSASPSTISSTFHFLFKVLFIFPSRYLFAIGLSPVFSLRRDLPPN